VSHALAGLGAEAGGDQLVVAPHRAVEEHQRGAVQPRFQLVIDLGAGGEEIEMLARGLVADAKAERVAGPVIAAGMRFALQIPRALAGDGEGQDLDAGGRAVGQFGLEGLVDLDWHAGDVLFTQYIKNAVGLQDRQHFWVRIDRKGRALAHRQEACHGVDFAIGEDHARDRRVAQRAFPGVKLRRADQLLAQVGRGIDQEPVGAIGAEGDGSLRALQFRVVGPRGPAHLASAIPLRNTAAGRCAQDDDAKHDPSPGSSRT